MSINSIGSNATPPEHRSSGNRQVDAAKTDVASADRNPAERTGDTVHISAKAIDLQAVEAQLKDLPDVDSARVEELRNQINNGSYQVDSQRLADRIMAFESGL